MTKKKKIMYKVNGAFIKNGNSNIKPQTNKIISNNPKGYNQHVVRQNVAIELMNETEINKDYIKAVDYDSLAKEIIPENFSLETFTDFFIKGLPEKFFTKEDIEFMKTETPDGSPITAKKWIFTESISSFDKGNIVWGDWLERTYNGSVKQISNAEYYTIYKNKARKWFRHKAKTQIMTRIREKLCLFCGEDLKNKNWRNNKMKYYDIKLKCDVKQVITTFTGTMKQLAKEVQLIDDSDNMSVVATQVLSSKDNVTAGSTEKIYEVLIFYRVRVGEFKGSNNLTSEDVKQNPGIIELDI